MYGKQNNYRYVVCAGATLKTILLFLIRAAPRESKRERAHKEACLGKVFFKTADISFRKPLFQFTELIVLISELSPCRLNFFSKSFNDF